MLILTAVGFGILCISLDRHYSKLFGVRRPPRNKILLLRWAGYVILSISILVGVFAEGFAYGLTLWFMAAALIVTLLALCFPLNWEK